MMRLAFLILLHDRAKALALVLGVAFATLLITQQAAIFHSVLQSSSRDVREVREAAIWISRPSVDTLDESDQLPETAVDRVRSVRGVAWASPYFQGLAVLRTPRGAIHNVQVIGIDLPSQIGAPRGLLTGSWLDLHQSDAVVLDVAGLASMQRSGSLAIGHAVEIGDQRALIVGLCRTGPAWNGLPRVITTRARAAAMTQSTDGSVSYVLAGIGAGEDARAVAQRIQAQTSFKAQSREDFAQATEDFILATSGIAENFGITILLGIIIGIAIVGQTFYMFSIENIKQFAVLKAMGLTNLRIAGLVAIQSLAVALTGYGFGIGATGLFFAIFSPALEGGLRGMYLDQSIAIATFCVIPLITLSACLLSMRRVLRVDPAVVFRG